MVMCLFSSQLVSWMSHLYLTILAHSLFTSQHPPGSGNEWSHINGSSGLFLPLGKHKTSALHPAFMLSPIPFWAKPTLAERATPALEKLHTKNPLFFEWTEKDTPGKRHRFWRVDAVLSRGSWLSKWNVGWISAPTCSAWSDVLTQGPSSTGCIIVGSSCVSGMLSALLLVPIDISLMGCSVSVWMTVVHKSSNGWNLVNHLNWSPFAARRAPQTIESLVSWNRAVFPLLPVPKLCPDAQWNVENGLSASPCGTKVIIKRDLAVASLSTPLHRVQHQSWGMTAARK